jgi:hypothetical protein
VLFSKKWWTGLTVSTIYQFIVKPIMTDLTQKSRTQFNKLQKRLRHYVGDAIADYNMME